MKQKWKRFLSVVLMFVTLVTSVPIYASVNDTPGTSTENSEESMDPSADDIVEFNLIYEDVSNEGVSLASLNNSEELMIHSVRFDRYWRGNVITSPSTKLNLCMSIKYVANDGANNVDTDGNARMAYCLEWQKGSPNADMTMKNKWTNMNVHYAMYYGCMYMDKTCRNPAYSAQTGDWRDDYVVTQVAIHILNNEFTLDEGIAAINEADPEAALAKEPGLTNLRGVQTPSAETKTKVANAVRKLVADARNSANYAGWDLNDGWMKLNDSTTTYDVTGYQDTWTKSSDGNYYSGGDFHITFNSINGHDMRDQISTVDIAVPSGVNVKKADAKTYSDFDLYISESQYREWAKTGKDIPVTVKITIPAWWGCAVYEAKDTTIQDMCLQNYVRSSGTYTVSKTVTLHIPQESQPFKLEVTKKDSLTGEGIEGCEFTVYEYNPNNSKYVALGKLGWDSSAKKYTSDSNSQLKSVLLADYSDIGNKGKFKIVETSVPNGYVPASAWSKEFVVTQSDSGQTIKFTYTAENDPTRVLIKKVDENGNTITGAHLEIYDPDNKKVAEFDSTSAGVEVDKLVVGKTYTLKETTVPAGYVKSNDVTFTVQDTKDVQTVTMTDKWTVTKFDKQLYSDKITYVPGASLELRTDKNNASSVVTTVTGTKVQWTSGSGNQTFYGIKPGTYWLVETKAPDGYATADPVQVTITASTDNKAALYNDKTKILIKKVDENGNTITGAHLVVYDASNNKIKEFDSTSSGVQIEGLLVGKKYTVKETTVPDGYVKSADVSFTVSDTDEVQTVTMTDKWTVTEFHKLLLSNRSTYVPGASLELRTNKTNANSVVRTVDGMQVKWVSGSGKQTFYGIKPGTYWLVETKAPTGYVTSEPVQVTVTSSLTNTATMYNDPTHVLIRKVDENGVAIVGARLALYNSYGKKINEFVSTAAGVEIQLLEVGKQYTLKETVVPDGYVKADDVTFTVRDVSGMQDVTMTDPWTKTDFTKLSLADRTTFVSGASLELRTNKDKANSVVTTITGTKVQWISGSGKQTFYGIKPGTYWLVETKTPTGYALSDPVQVTITASRNNTGIMYDLPYADLTVVKRIRADHINFANGNPTFIFTVKGNDLLGNYHEYSEFFEFTKDYVQRNTGSDGYVSLSYTWKSIPVGTSYNVMENDTNRYYLTDVTSRDSNVSIRRLKNSAYGVRPEDTFRVTTNLQTKLTGTTITFTNVKKAWGNWGHNAVVKNTVKVV